MIPLDWVASGLELTAGWILGNKNRFGFILAILCGICWALYVLMSKSTYGLLIVVIPGLVINVRNWIKWGKED